MSNKPTVPPALVAIGDLSILWDIVCEVYQGIRKEYRDKNKWPTGEHQAPAKANILEQALPRIRDINKEFPWTDDFIGRVWREAETVFESKQPQR